MAKDDASVQQLGMQIGHTRRDLIETSNFKIILPLIVLFRLSSQQHTAYEFYFQTSSQACPA
jgi:hypothetical protein